MHYSFNLSQAFFLAVVFVFSFCKDSLGSSGHALSKRDTAEECPKGNIIDLNGNCVKKFQIPKRKQCPEPSVSKFGSYELRSGGRFATFSCEEGWALVPDHDHAMCRVGDWDRVIPNCVRPGCQRLEPEGGVRMQRLLNGALIEFQCYQTGMALVGPAVLGCDGEFWNGTAPVCRDTPSAATPPATLADPPETEYRVDPPVSRGITAVSSGITAAGMVLTTLLLLCVS